MKVKVARVLLDVGVTERRALLRQAMRRRRGECVRRREECEQDGGADALHRGHVSVTKLRESDDKRAPRECRGVTRAHVRGQAQARAAMSARKSDQAAGEVEAISVYARIRRAATDSADVTVDTDRPELIHARNLTFTLDRAFEARSGDLTISAMIC